MHVARITLIVMAALFASGTARAERKKIVVLDFGGSGGDWTRSWIVGELEVDYQVIPGRQLVAECDKQGIPPERGPNLARCASALGAVAVVGGKREAGNKLSLAVYSGQTGKVLIQRTVNWSDSKARISVKQALAVIRKGMKKAPKTVTPIPPPPKQPAVEPEPEPTPGPTKSASPTSAPVTRTQPVPPVFERTGESKDPSSTDSTSDLAKESDGTLTFAPDEVGRTHPRVAQARGTKENPLEAEVNTKQKSVVVPAQDRGFEPKILATIGFGTWVRNFSVDQGLGYESGATFALRFQLKVRPLAFFLDTALRNIFLRMHYRMLVGQETEPFGTGTAATKLGTTQGELVADLGYRWNILNKALGPRLEFAVGFGMFDFSVDWPDVNQQALPDLAYRFLNLSVGLDYPFLRWLSGFARFDGRVVLSSGEIEDTTRWFGSASNGGFDLSAGLRANVVGFVASLEYAFTGYFLSFDNVANPGATDTGHLLMVSAGYSF